MLLYQSNDIKYNLPIKTGSKYMNIKKWVDKNYTQNYG